MKIKYRPEIDGLRAIAVAAVVFYHAKITLFGAETFQGGFIGVDIFFVVSGYLITSIILKELITTGKFSFKYFYERRIRRLIPAFLLVTLATVPLGWVFLMPGNFLDFANSVLYALGFSSNFYFYSGLEYNTDIGLSKPFLHTWSLSVEEQYYIFFPIILLLVFKYFKKYLGLIFISGFVLSLALADFGSRIYPKLNFYMLPTRGWELIAGSLLAYYEIKKGYRNGKRVYNLILPILGIVLIIHSIFFFNDEMLHPSLYTLSPILGVCLIIWYANKNDIVTKVLSSKFLVGIGLISYSLYLWHYPIINFLEIKYFYFDNKLKIISITVSLILSILSYYYIEKVFRNKVAFKFVFKIIAIIYFFVFIILSFSIHNNQKINRFKKFEYHSFLNFEKYEKEKKLFEENYNYNKFDERKNIFIVGNSYAKDLLNVFNFNKELSNKYYFYTPSSRNYKKLGNYQLTCFEKFLKENNTFCENKNYTNHLNKQYLKSDYIIFAVKGPSRYLERFLEINNQLKKDGKKFVVYLDDVRGKFINNMNSLDRFVFINKRIPNDQEVKYLERQFYKNSKLENKNKLQKIKEMFKKNKINYILRSEIYCDDSRKICKLITTKNKKIYSDSGHLTNAGALFFSDSVSKLIKKIN